MNPNEKEDELDLLSLPKAAVIECIIEQYGEQLKRMIFTYVKSYAQSDDIFQEFLIAVYKNLDQFMGDAKLKTWLYRIAINKCKDYLKSPLHRMIHLKEQVKDTGFSKSPEELTVEEEDRLHIAKAIFSMPVKYREILILRFYQELTIHEISDLLDVNESTVKTRIARGKEKLRFKLGGEKVAKI